MKDVDSREVNERIIKNEINLRWKMLEALEWYVYLLMK